MTKYEEIIKAHKNAIKKFENYRKKCEDYRKKCQEFAVDLILELINYLRCPDEKVVIFPLTKEFEKGKEYKIQQAMNFEDNNFGHFGVNINLGNVGSISLPIMIKKSNRYFIVSVEGRDEEFKIDKNDYKGLKVFFDFIFKLIMDDYEKEPYQIYDKELNIRKIGFL